MMGEATFWLLLNFISLIALSFYSMIEMACVSFNRIRLHYYVAKENLRAIWIHELLKKPSKLFGTTLLGVNLATFIGSECAREFLSVLGINPNWAPLPQVIIVIIFGELAPMFAARNYAEHVSMLGAPLLYFSTIVLAPFLWVLELFNKICNRLMGGKEEDLEYYLSEEELQRIVQEKDDSVEGEALDTASANIFAFKRKTAKTILLPISQCPLLPTSANVGEVRQLMKNRKDHFVLLYNKGPTNIVALVILRDLIRLPDQRRLAEYTQTPWFILGSTPLPQLLEQFRRNREHLAVVLNPQGQATGILTLERLIEEILGKKRRKQAHPMAQGPIKRIMIASKTCPGDITLEDFCHEFNVEIPGDQALTLSEWMTETLGHHPNEGDALFVDPLEITVKETSLFEVKSVTVSQRQSGLG